MMLIVGCGLEIIDARNERFERRIRNECCFVNQSIVVVLLPPLFN